MRYSITVRQNPCVKRAFEEITEVAWTPINYTANGEAWVGETRYLDHRLIVRRTKLNEPQPALFPTSATTPSSPTVTETASCSTPITVATR